MLYKNRFVILFIAGICILMYLFFDKKDNYVNEYNTKIKALEAKVDSLHSENEGLNNNILELNLQITNLDHEIDRYKHVIDSVTKANSKASN